MGSGSLVIGIKLKDSSTVCFTTQAISLALSSFYKLVKIESQIFLVSETLPHAFIPGPFGDTLHCFLFLFCHFFSFLDEINMMGHFLIYHLLVAQLPCQFISCLNFLSSFHFSKSLSFCTTDLSLQLIQRYREIYRA